MSSLDTKAPTILHLVSYSYPPDNTPAAHRPYQLAQHLSRKGQAFRVYTKYGVLCNFEKVADGMRSVDPSLFKRKFGRKYAGHVVNLMSWLADIDKALFWGMRTLPRLWLDLVRTMLVTKRRQDVWTTSPSITNLYVAVLACFFSFSRLHVDLRDAINGINARRMPVLTHCALRYASTVSVVTDSLQSFVERRAPWVNPVVIYNGVSEDAVKAAKSAWQRSEEGWIRVAYVGAVYGGERPYPRALDMLQRASERLPETYRGIELRFVGREDVSELPVRYDTDRFRVIPGGEVSKSTALSISASSDVNLILVGGAEEHRCGIPLKTFDLLGVGRAVLFVGPFDSDAAFFLKHYASDLSLLLDSETPVFDEGLLASWLVLAASTSSSPRQEPSSDSNSGMILALISGQQAGRAA